MPDPIPASAARARTGAPGACVVCGLVQWIPESRPGEVCRCARCDERFRAVDRRGASVRRAWVVSLAIAALVLYPAAMMLPVMRIERLGYAKETTVWGGVVSLIEDGHAVIGMIVLLCSIVIPLSKLVAMLWLSAATSRGDSGRDARPGAPHRLTHAAVEFLGRWGMLDVLLVAVLVAAIKLGDLMTVRAGPGVAAFGAMVVLSLLASAVFEPRDLWTTETETEAA